MDGQFVATKRDLELGCGCQPAGKRIGGSIVECACRGPLHADQPAGQDREPGFAGADHTPLVGQRLTSEADALKEFVAGHRSGPLQRARRHARRETDGGDLLLAHWENHLGGILSQDIYCLALIQRHTSDLAKGAP